MVLHVAALSLGTQHYESRARTGQLSVSIMWLGGISCQCLGRDISVRQHSKSEHLTSYHIQTPSQYDWRLLKATFSPKQTFSLPHPDTVAIWLKTVESDVKPKTNKHFEVDFDLWIVILPLLQKVVSKKTSRMANSIDPDKMAYFKLSHQDLLCKHI